MKGRPKGKKLLENFWKRMQSICGDFFRERGSSECCDTAGFKRRKTEKGVL